MKSAPKYQYPLRPSRYPSRPLRETEIEESGENIASIFTQRAQSATQSMQRLVRQ